MEFGRPRDLESALELLAKGDWSVLSGGTDFYPALNDHLPKKPVLDISGIDRLRSIREEEDHWSIGALTTWTDVMRTDLPPSFDGLKLAAREIGSVQIQNRATLVGNICNASPAADGMPPLLTLDAIVRLSSSSGHRDLPLSRFVTGNRQTELGPDELVTELRIPKRSATGRSHFLKLGARKYLVISISMVAARLVVGQDREVTDAAVSVGSCSAVAVRLSGIETFMKGRVLSTDLISSVQPNLISELSPIDDVRSTAVYRSQATVEIVRRALLEIAENGDRS